MFMWGVGGELVGVLGMVFMFWGVRDVYVGVGGELVGVLGMVTVVGMAMIGDGMEAADPFGVQYSKGLMETRLNNRELVWELIVLKHDLKDLERERTHLNSKCAERSLTYWELQRLEELLDESMQLLEKFGSIRAAHDFQEAA